MSNKKSKTDESSPVPVRLPPDMRKSVRDLAEKSGLTDAAILRLAIERGLRPVEKMFEPEKQAA